MSKKMVVRSDLRCQSMPVGGHSGSPPQSLNQSTPKSVRSIPMPAYVASISGVCVCAHISQILAAF